MNISGELENYSRQNSIAETLGLYSSLDIRDPFSSGPETNLNKWTKNNKTNDNA